MHWSRHSTKPTSHPHTGHASRTIASNWSQPTTLRIQTSSCPDKQTKTVFITGNWDLVSNQPRSESLKDAFLICCIQLGRFNNSARHRTCLSLERAFAQVATHALSWRATSHEEPKDTHCNCQNSKTLWPSNTNHLSLVSQDHSKNQTFRTCLGFKKTAPVC